ncbi:UDP-N-acetylmuramoyl-L-alanyl-D-glutamate--2,6-diaminopimelate ligase [Halanaerobium salsuginis]|uniref:UDP-N-acetylmuramoyl-L-alanyl-D-glutamate--2,6-diaminopimelate ligase n=1 Tax=Halanaerobium salsuginis TaxID=29563 RepID=A0A1I4GFV9_9FIRM|nr:UDP-N-acetylmuramoyl-L-alanyl-D-glutamate--2,6-diaminopimelate ligase [Halanaerobium salsuginis]SFL28433.1 UDP-N-acetylmuramoylalanyl-D-glutamate--2,6-diaminopimelate ligase [Halanaerobium salsuginis]
MKLKDILTEINFKLLQGDLEQEIKELSYDSRTVRKESLFIAITGFETDGHAYIDQAVKEGASAVVVEKSPAKFAPGITYLQVENSRRDLALLAKNFYHDPLQKIKLIGVTGTNGKTTTSFLIHHILESAGKKAALFGTIKNLIGKKELSSSRTTPESLDLYKYFYSLQKQEIEYAVMEVSSHALALYRVYGMKFSAAVFTNLTSEHLDYHRTMLNYKKAKAKLFTQLKKDGFAVFNFDDQAADFMIQSSAAQNNLTYSLVNENADLSTANYELHNQDLHYQTKGVFKVDIALNTGGVFNIYNSLAAALTAYKLGINKELIVQSFKKFSGVPGRYEIINAGQDFQLVVDYAHTPDGMENVLQSALANKKNNLIVVFGCGGDRDRSKRSLMGNLAEQYADYTIVTNDNPRSEDPADIFTEIKTGFSKDFKDYEVIADRKQAIARAIDIAQKDDSVFLLGRGHEKYQIIKDQKIKLDDRKVALELLKTKV